MTQSDGHHRTSHCSAPTSVTQCDAICTRYAESHDRTNYSRVRSATKALTCTFLGHTMSRRVAAGGGFALRLDRGCNITVQSYGLSRSVTSGRCYT
jgi:hypothetical protein